MKFVVKHKVELILLFILIVSYLILRLPNLTLQPIFADEAIYIRWAQVMRSEPTLRFLPLSDGKTPLFMWLMIPLLKVFQDPLFAGRFLSVISGFFTLLGVLFLTKKVFNLKAAFWAALFYVITPYTVFFDRMALVDSMLAAFNIWIIYFAIWLTQNLRLDLAMFLGYLMGGAILTKTPGLINLILLPASLFSIKIKDKKYIIRLVLLWLVAIGIALVIYNLLRLGPNFHQLSSRNADYIFSPQELKGRVLDPFIPHFYDISDWFPKLFTPLILIFAAIGIFLVVKKYNKFGITILLWAIVPLLLNMAFLKTFTARYLLSAIAPSLVLAGLAISSILEKIRLKNFLKIFLAFILLLPIALKFDYYLIKNPPPKNLPQEEKKGYFADWTAGYGLKEIAQILLEESKKHQVVVATEGSFGTLPDGLYIYLDKSNIAVIGSAATISAKIRAAAKDNATFFVGNKNSLKNTLKNVKLIKEFPKVKFENETEDATVLYSVLPDEKNY